MAANYQHIGGGENRLGRHYSRFSAFWPPAALADQSLALRKSQNAGSNRRSRVSAASSHCDQLGLTNANVADRTKHLSVGELLNQC